MKLILPLFEVRVTVLVASMLANPAIERELLALMSILPSVTLYSESLSDAILSVLSSGLNVNEL
ncbi:hypothetical protein protein [Bacillus cereus G9241]|nr:hypothetical protein protein [Bacillus cereus G9241]